MKNVYVITGGSSGIGLECAKRFSDGKVLITGRNEDRLIKAAKELSDLGIDVIWKSSDVSNLESLEKLFDFAKENGKVKAVINSAGVSGVGVDSRLTFNIDLIGAENLIKLTLDDAENGTVLILIASMMGHMVPANSTYDEYLKFPGKEGAIDALVKMAEGRSDLAYNWSKRGVHLMAKEYAAEFGKKGARIVSISPGIIMTPMAKKAAEVNTEQMEYMKMMTPAGRNGESEDIANAVEFLASDKASFITGTDLIVDGGLTTKLPEIMAQYSKK